LDPYFVLGIEDSLIMTGQGKFGFDTVTMPELGAGGPTVNHSIVAGVKTQEFWRNIFGVSGQSQNSSTYSDPQPSYMSLLKQNGNIPNLSYGYTAGNPYTLNGIFGDFVFGKYDLSQFEQNNYSFIFGQSVGRELYVGLQSITTT
jgi:hypothetical protein